MANTLLSRCPLLGPPAHSATGSLSGAGGLFRGNQVPGYIWHVLLALQLCLIMLFKRI